MLFVNIKYRVSERQELLGTLERTRLLVEREFLVFTLNDLLDRIILLTRSDAKVCLFV